MNRAATAICVVALWSAAMFGAGWTWRGDRAEGREANQRAGGAVAVAAQVNQTRAIEHQQAEDLSAIGAKHEEDRTSAPAVADAVVAGVRAGDLRLRDGWASCETQRLSDAVAAASERDAAAERRAEFAGAVVRVGRDADDQLAACQAVVRALGR